MKNKYSKRIVRVFLLALLFLFFRLEPAFAGPAYNCIQCHTAGQISAMGAHSISDDKSFYLIAHNPCPGLRKMDMEVYLTGARIMETNHALAMPGRWGGQGLPGIKDELDRLYVNFEDTKLGYPGDLSEIVVQDRLAEIMSETGQAYQQLNDARDAIRAGKAAVVGVFIFLCLVAAVFVGLKRPLRPGRKSVFLLILIVLFSCDSARQTEKNYANEIAKADVLSQEAENTAARAWQTAGLAFLPEAGSRKGALIANGVACARLFPDTVKIRYAQELTKQSANWPAYWNARARQAVQRLIRASGAGWPLRAIGGLMAQNGEKEAAGKLIEASISISGKLTGPERDFELKAASVELCPIDLSGALKTASEISSPLIRAAALRGVGERLGSVRILKLALAEVFGTGPADPCQKALETGRIALAMYRAGDSEEAKQALDAAIDTAGLIKGDAGAYALDTLARYAAQVDPGKAGTIAGMIDWQFPEQHCEAGLDAGFAGQNELLSIISHAAGIKDPYEHDRILCRAVSMLASISPEDALKISDSAAFHFPKMRAEALSTVFAGLLAKDDSWTEKINSHIPDAYWRAWAFYKAAAEMTAHDKPRTASRLFNHAMREARQAKSQFLPWRIAMDWGMLWLELGGQPADEFRSQFEGRPGSVPLLAWEQLSGDSGQDEFVRMLRSADPYFASVWMGRVASKLSKSAENGAAREAFAIAVAKARGVKDPFLKCFVNISLAKKGFIIDNKKARAAFDTALDAASVTGPLQGSSAP